MLLSLFLILIVSSLLLWLIFTFYRTIPCPSWLGWLIEINNPLTKTNQSKTIISKLNVTPGMAVLDAGCGPGRLTLPLAKAVGGRGRITALDLQEQMLIKVKEKASKEGLTNIDYLNAPLKKGVLKQRQFDRILLVTVLGEIKNQKNALKELFDALKEDGVLLITEVIFDPHFQTQKHVKRLAESTGFRVLSIYGNTLAYLMLLSKR